MEQVLSKEAALNWERRREAWRGKCRKTQVERSEPHWPPEGPSQALPLLH